MTQTAGRVGLASGAYGAARQMLCGFSILDCRLSIAGSVVCASCGSPLDSAALPLLRAVPDSFTDWRALCRFGGKQICAGCQALLKDSTLRTQSLLVLPDGTRRKLAWADFWPLLKEPPEICALTWAQSLKKHAWLYAGLSTSAQIALGTDNQTILYRPADHAGLLPLVEGLLLSGIGKRTLTAGRYHPADYQKAGHAALRDVESRLAPHRPTGLLEWLVTAFPAPTTQPALPPREEPLTMIDPQDRQAAAFLQTFARHSQYRREHGKEFWDGFFLHRVERVARMPLRDAADRLLLMLHIPPMTRECVELLTGLDAEQTAAIEQAIAKRPRLLVALAYTFLQEEKAAARNGGNGLFDLEGGRE